MFNFDWKIKADKKSKKVGNKEKVHTEHETNNGLSSPGQNFFEKNHVKKIQYIH